MESSYFVAVDFDGTVIDTDIIDAVLQEFARPEWKNVESLWEQGLIGSRECLARQVSMIDRPLNRLLEYIDRFSIDKTFQDFIFFLKAQHIPHAIVSDGFRVFIERLLANAGLNEVPVYANRLFDEQGLLKTDFPYSNPDCTSANCKCSVIADICKDRSLVMVGDGRSDFCLAHKAVHASNL